MKKIVLRMDDVGASSKKFEIYSKYRLGNFLFFKYYYPFKAMGPYDELSANQWDTIFEILDNHNAKLTVGLTAGWVDKNNNIIPFDEKFPKQTEKIKEGIKKNLIEISNHGLTHCVVGKHKPKLFSSNRRFHREFWDYLDQDIHDEHIFQSQTLIKNWLGYEPYSFVPPGNVYSPKTLKSLSKTRISIINASKKLDCDFNQIRFVNNDNVFPFHDRDLSIFGIEWLEKKIKQLIEDNNEIKFLNLSEI